jgi:DNA-directed RNA polymerase subunit M/transcription elongation factor TFIIS
MSTFKQPTYEEALEKKKAAQKRARERAASKPRKVAKKRSKVAKQANKKKSKTQAQLKKELDKVFSLYIRQKYADDMGNVECYTCGKVMHWKKIQNGHFISRAYLATRWHEDNCRPQDIGCNIFGNGKPLDFEERLKKELGDEYVEEMKASRHQSLKLDRNWYIEQIAVYKEKLSTLTS